MKPRQLIMAAALAAAAGLAYFGDKTPTATVAEAVVRSPARSKAATSPPAPAEAAIQALRSRAELIGEEGEFGAERAVFLSQNWAPPPPKPPKPSTTAPPPPPPPSAPPFPFTYVGKAAGDGSWEVFLARADKTYIVRNKTVIDGMYRVDTIAPPLMTLTYLPLNQVQQLNIGVLD